MADVWRACGCRGDDGKQLGKDCPRLADGKHGTWRYRISAGVDPRTGKRVQELKAGFPTKKAAQQARNERLRQLDTGEYRPRVKQTTGDYLTAWLDKKITLGDLRASSVRMYSRYVAEDLIPAIGRIQLTELRPHDIDDMVTKLLAAGRGSVTVRRIHATLRSALSDARRLQLIVINPAAAVSLPRVDRPKVRPWEPAELGAFLEVASRDRLGAMFEVAAFAGLRRGEMAGLRWGDVDMERGVLTIRSQIVEVGSEKIEERPKTASGEARRIAVADRVVGALLAHQIAQQAEREAWGAAYVDGGRVFCKENGEDLAPDFIGRLFRRLMRTAGVRPVRLHDLRHGAASLMLAAGTDIAVVSKMLGHSSVSITSDTYSHLIGDAGRNAAEGAAALVPITTVHTLCTPRGVSGLAGER